jgi:general secretion pathway protein D
MNTLLALVLSGCMQTAKDRGTSDPAMPKKLIVIKHTTADDCLRFLSEMDLGVTVVKTRPDTLELTGSEAQLHLASGVLDVIDVNEPSAVLALGPVTQARNLPSNKEITQALQDVAIGTFAEPPAQETVSRVIIDIFRDNVVAIGPRRLLDEIQVVMRRAPRPTAMSKPASQVMPVFSNKPEPKTAPPSLPEQVGATPERGEHIPPAAVETAAVTSEPPQPVIIRSSTGTPSSGPRQRPQRVALNNGENVVELDLPEQIGLIQLIDMVGEYMDFDYLYDPQKIKDQPVTLKLHGKLRGEIRVKDLYALLETVLKFKGMAMTRKEQGLVAIVPIGEVMDMDPELVDMYRARSADVTGGDMVVTGVFHPEHIAAASVTELLQSMKLGIETTALDHANALLVTCYAHRLARIERLLALIDRPGAPKVLSVRVLNYTLAGSIAQKVRVLAQELEGMEVSVGTPSGDSKPRRPTGEQEGAAPGERAKPQVYLDTDERTNRLLIIGTEAQLTVMNELIDMLDVTQQDLRCIVVYTLEHAEAADVQFKLAELGVVSAGQTATSSSRSGPPGSRSKNLIADAPQEQAQLVVLESTNALLVLATDQQHTQIRMILDYMDVQRDDQAIPYEIYFLENQSPEHMSTILNNIIMETVLDQNNKVERVIPTTDERIVIVPDELTFALIVYASRKNQEWISKLITKLDKRRPQVLIDVTLVEIRKTDEFSYDLNLISSLPDLLQTGGQTGSFLVGGQTVVDKLTQPGMRSRFMDFQSNAGLGTGFYADTHVNALLTAMQSKNYGRVLAKPKILVNDNESGTIKTTETTYVTKKSSIPVASGGGGTQSTLVETAVDYEGYDAGITLEITPHTSKSDLLRLDINLIRSDFGNITGDVPPDKASSDLTTVVTVPDSSTIILGGMLRLNQSKGGKKVPILGDIPLIGALFRGLSNKDIQNKLYIFVRAEIIRPEETLAALNENLKRISEQNREAFEQHESEFQQYQDWPGVEPKPTDPEKVLDVK